MTATYHYTYYITMDDVGLPQVLVRIMGMAKKPKERNVS